MFDQYVFGGSSHTKPQDVLEDHLSYYPENNMSPEHFVVGRCIFPIEKINPILGDMLVFRGCSKYLIGPWLIHPHRIGFACSWLLKLLGQWLNFKLVWDIIFSRQN